MISPVNIYINGILVGAAAPEGLLINNTKAVVFAEDLKHYRVLVPRNCYRRLQRFYNKKR